MPVKAASEKSKNQRKKWNFLNKENWIFCTDSNHKILVIFLVFTSKIATFPRL